MAKHEEQIGEFIMSAVLIYTLIGVAHSLYLFATVSRVDCITAKQGMVWVWCNVGGDWAHYWIALVWPYFWLH